MKKITVPLELINLHDDGFHLLVEVVIFNRKFNAVLDTGASKTVLDKTIIESYINAEELLQSEKLSTGLGTSTMESHTVILPSFKIGKLILKHFEAAVLDLSTISTAYETLNLPPVIGVLGGDILYSHNAVINYEKLELKLLPNSL
ncbi:retropepsin-like aspartic protease [Daejeonella lutea]|uniref:Aspartyl protease n=1 Tax=Daejeonella lutea TaxID=572036 RepID=A0A1T4ZZL9_9SPHI|nr:retropepsin-like aspartic protease [Daejeonella lutea]SKB28182.1 Aspartyl protease [Daejeonella lutea]